MGCGIDLEEWSGYAFGMDVDRTARIISSLPSSSA